MSYRPLALEKVGGSFVASQKRVVAASVLAFKTISETKHDKDMQEDKKKYLVEDYKSAMYDISRFANEGADLLGKGPDGGAEESKKDFEEAEPNSPKP